ncbi:MAG: Slp family lipoprotein [Syntrophaceae bacterium]|nr:Slp family lipoprotein [Syntrophaceae bacterium]
MKIAKIVLLCILRLAKYFLFSLLLMVISGCAYPISKELRQEVTKDITFPMVLQDPTAYMGSIVLWGGIIIETMNHPEGSEITVLETPLDYMEEPEPAKHSRGRFVAKTSKFLDPEVYKQRKRITLAGEIVGKEVKPLGKSEYTYPVVLVKQLYLWPKERRYIYSPPYYWYDPYWVYPYGPYGWREYGYGPYGPYEEYRDED